MPTEITIAALSSLLEAVIYIIINFFISFDSHIGFAKPYIADRDNTEFQLDIG